MPQSSGWGSPEDGGGLPICAQHPPGGSRRRWEGETLYWRSFDEERLSVVEAK